MKFLVPIARGKLFPYQRMKNSKFENTKVEVVYHFLCKLDNKNTQLT